MTFNPHTLEDRSAMLQAIGVGSTTDLFDVIPESVRFPDLQLPPLLTEMEAGRRLQNLAARNLAPGPGQTFLGAGSYHHFVPATVNQIISRGEFYTAYTPYQPEVAQGTLQTIYEFQTMVAGLLGLDIANASLYDGATALAEAALVTVSTSKKRQRIVIAGTVHPSYIEVMRSYLAGLPIEIIELPLGVHSFSTSVDEVRGLLDESTACLVVQYPNFYGGIEDVAALADAAHQAGAAAVVSTYPIPLGMLKSPGELGADVVAAEGQSLGVAQSYGGPYVGLLAARQKFVRQLPGRIAGMTTDSEGKRGFVLTLQTREQHIRREKATSNICTNQGLMATAATVHMASLGPEGFREVAVRSFQNAHYLAGQISNKPGYALANDTPFFHEFVIQTPRPAREINDALLEAGIIGGYDLARVEQRLDHHLLLCATEVHTRSDLDAFVAALPE